MEVVEGGSKNISLPSIHAMIYLAQFGHNYGLLIPKKTKLQQKEVTTPTGNHCNNRKLCDPNTTALEINPRNSIIWQRYQR